MRPFNKSKHPRGWRSYMEYGNGTIGDMGIHMFDMVRWFMDLGWPKRISSSGGLRVLKGGRTLADSLATHPDYFGELYVNMVRAGEASGSLAQVFEQLPGRGARVLRRGHVGHQAPITRHVLARHALDRLAALGEQQVDRRRDVLRADFRKARQTRKIEERITQLKAPQHVPCWRSAWRWSSARRRRAPG